MKRILFFSIILVASLVRFVMLDSNPPSLTWDEVSWGYNAYALGTDGKDEFGIPLPILYLESFGDFKPPLYAYLDILPVKFFGLNEFSTRFPSAFFGTLSVLVTYFLVKEIFKKDEVALLSMFLLAISPWHIMLSRAAFEANVAHFFILLGVFLFLRSMRGSPHILILSVLSFALSMYTFNSARVVVPLLFLGLGIMFSRRLYAQWKKTLLSYAIGAVVIFPLFIFLSTPQAQLRFNEVNIFSDIGIITRLNQQVENDNNAFYSKILHNRRFAYAVEYLRHYIDNLTPQFLFIKGDGNPKFSIQDVGQLYIWEIPFLVIGCLYLFRKREGYWWVVPLMLLVAIIPAGFARETPHALRTENALPSFQIITAIGIINISKHFLKWRKIALIIVGILISFHFLYFLHNYFTHYGREFSGEWQYGYKESVNYVLSQKDNYQNVYVTEELGRPYIYYLFYSKYDPALFRREAKIYREPLGFVHVLGYSNIKFTENVERIYDANALYISTPNEAHKKARILKEFRLLNGSVHLVAYTL